MTDAAYLRTLFGDVGSLHLQVWSEFGQLMRCVPVVKVGNGVWGSTLAGVRRSDHLVLVTSQSNVVGSVTWDFGV